MPKDILAWIIFQFQKWQVLLLVAEPFPQFNFQYVKETAQCCNHLFLPCIDFNSEHTTNEFTLLSELKIEIVSSFLQTGYLKATPLVCTDLDVWQHDWWIPFIGRCGLKVNMVNRMKIVKCLQMLKNLNFFTF